MGAGRLVRRLGLSAHGIQSRQPCAPPQGIVEHLGELFVRRGGDRVPRGPADLALRRGIGLPERPVDRGGHSLFCTAVTILADGTIAIRHRKLVPTYEERLVWAIGDGHGLRTHKLGPFTAMNMR